MHAMHKKGLRSSFGWMPSVRPGMTPTDAVEIEYRFAGTLPTEPQGSAF